MTLGAIAGFAFIYSILFLVTKKKLHLNSHVISQNTTKVVKFLQEGLGGIRDILIDGTQATYSRAFQAVDVARRRALVNNRIIAQSPRYGIESLGMVLIAWLAFSLSDTETGLISALPIIGALALGAQRMLPMLQNIYGSLSSIRGGQGILQDSLALLEQSLPKYANKLTSETILFQKVIISKICLILFFYYF